MKFENLNLLWISSAYFNVFQSLLFVTARKKKALSEQNFKKGELFDYGKHKNTWQPLEIRPDQCLVKLLIYNLILKGSEEAWKHLSVRKFQLGPFFDLFV